METDILPALKPTEDTGSDLYTGLPNYFISSLNYEVGVLSLIMEKYMDLHNKNTIIFQLGRRSERFTLNHLRFHYKNADMVIDFLFKELQLRELESQSGIPKFLEKKADLLLVIYQMSALDTYCSPADSTQKATTYFKLKTIIQKGKDLGIGVIAGDSVKLIKGNMDSWFKDQDRTKVDLKNKQFIVIKIKGKDLNRKFHFPLRSSILSKSYESEEDKIIRRGAEQPFNKAYELLLLSDQASCFLGKEMSEIKTFKLQYRLGLTLTATVRGLRSVYI
jgi:hypothetical protein